MRKSILLLIIAFTALNQAYSQIEYDPVTFASPNASSFSRYGQMPVSLYTGIPDINIPLWEINVGSMKVPISINYNASGIKVGDKSTMIGLGWSINTGGGISRQVMGVPDETTGGFIAYGGSKVMNIVQNYLPLNMLPVYLHQYLWGFDLTGVQRGLLKEMSENSADRSDSEPDIYFLSLPGSNGRFFFKNDGKILQMIKNNCILKYKRHNTDLTFNVTDSKGVKYYFNSYESVYADGGQAFPYTSLQRPYWNLDTITDRYNNIIRYSYVTRSVNCYEFFSNDFMPKTAILRENWTFNNYTNKIIDSIIAPNQTLVFYTNQNRLDIQGESVLDSINVFDLNKKVVRRIKFYHSYFVGTPLNVWFGDPYSHYRLRLDSLRINDEMYRFSYNETPLPSRYSKSQDAWGYYNGAQNSTLIPTYFSTEDDYSYSGADRHPNPDVNQACMLTDITYPTKGRTHLEYETNQVYDKMFNNIPYLVPYHYEDTTTGSFDAHIGHSLTFPFSVNLGDINYHFYTYMYPDTIGWENRVSIEILTSSDQLVATLEPFKDYSPGTLSQGNYKIVITGYQTYSSYIEVQFEWDRPDYDLSSTYDPYINKTVGGLRIKSVTDFDQGNKISNHVSYKYLKDQSNSISSGLVFNYPKFHKKDNRNFEINLNTCQISHNPYMCDLDGEETYVYGENVTPLVFNTDQLIGYSTVTEEFVANGSNGSIVHNFSDITSDPDIKFAEDFDFEASPYTSVFWKRGLPVSTKYYSNTGSTKLLVKQELNYYSKKDCLYDSSQSSIGIAFLYKAGLSVAPQCTNLWQDCMKNDPSNPLSISYFRPYIITTGWCTLDSSKVIEIRQADSIIAKKCFIYSNPIQDTNLLLKEEYTSLSDGNVLKTIFKYPQDYSNIQNDDYGIFKLKELHLIDQVVEKSQYFKSNVGTYNLTNSVFNSYYINNGNLKTQYTIFTNELMSGFIPSHTVSSNIYKDYRYVPTIFCDYYDNKGNLLQFHHQDGINKSYCWGYQGTYPIAETINASSNEYGYTSFENNEAIPFQLTTGNPNYYTNDPFTGKSSLMVQFGTGTYQIFAINSNATNHSGYKASVWVKGSTMAYISLQVPGVSSTLRKAENTGNNIATWNLLTVELPRTLLEPYLTNNPLLLKVETGVPGETAKFDDLRFCPMDAEMTTYTYEPLIGMTSASDANNKPTYYEYDAFGRLSIIKDYLGNILKKFDYHYRPQ